MHNVDSWKKIGGSLRKPKLWEKALTIGLLFLPSMMNLTPFMMMFTLNVKIQKTISKNSTVVVTLIGCPIINSKPSFFFLIPSPFAEQLMPYFKSILLITEFETATIKTIRRHLFKVTVRVYRSIRRLWFRFTSSFVYQHIFIALHQNILDIQ